MNPWLSAFRLRTLPLAVSSILVGSGLARYHGVFKLPVFILALLTAVLLQLLSNLANDLGDHQHGADNRDRVGPQRAVQSGAISPAAMKRAMIICGMLAFTSGCALIITAFGFSITMLAFLALGIAAIAAAVKYTFGKNPYGYAGLGDMSVFVFFGIVGVAGTYYVHVQALSSIVWLPAITFGALATGVLNLNNMRDIVNDAAVGKRTIPVRLGMRNAKWYHTFLILVSVSGVVWFSVEFVKWGLWFVIGLGTLNMLLDAISIWRNNEPAKLDPRLRSLAMSIFIIAMIMTISFFDDPI